ncbi:MAG: hypothetical protein M1820_000730 [Bogoriella megaspora]|nr:MAG: hypothetical protein M1820_000730 [Bogoriella megaspora]
MAGPSGTRKTEWRQLMELAEKQFEPQKEWREFRHRRAPIVSFARKGEAVEKEKPKRRDRSKKTDSNEGASQGNEYVSKRSLLKDCRGRAFKDWRDLPPNPLDTPLLEGLRSGSAYAKAESVSWFLLNSKFTFSANRIGKATPAPSQTQKFSYAHDSRSLGLLAPDISDKGEAVDDQLSNFPPVPKPSRSPSVTGASLEHSRYNLRSATPNPLFVSREPSVDEDDALDRMDIDMIEGRGLAIDDAIPTIESNNSSTYSQSLLGLRLELPSCIQPIRPLIGQPVDQQCMPAMDPKDPNFFNVLTTWKQNRKNAMGVPLSSQSEGSTSGQVYNITQHMQKNYTCLSFCGRRDDDEDMIGCSTPGHGNRFYHYSCVGLEAPPEEDEEWYCPDCTSSETHHQYPVFTQHVTNALFPSTNTNTNHDLISIKGRGLRVWQPHWTNREEQCILDIMMSLVSEREAALEAACEGQMPPPPKQFRNRDALFQHISEKLWTDYGFERTKTGILSRWDGASGLRMKTLRAKDEGDIGVAGLRSIRDLDARVKALCMSAGIKGNGPGQRMERKKIGSWGKDWKEDGSEKKKKTKSGKQSDGGDNYGDCNQGVQLPEKGGNSKLGGKQKAEYAARGFKGRSGE